MSVGFFSLSSMTITTSQIVSITPNFLLSKLIKLGVCQQGFKDLFNKIYMLQCSGHITGFGLPVYM